MKIWWAVALTLLVTSCSSPAVYNGREPYSGASFSLTETPRHTLDYFIEGMANQLVQSNQYLTAQIPVAVTSFVDLQSMSETNWLGNAVQKALCISCSTAVLPLSIIKLRVRLK